MKKLFGLLWILLLLLPAAALGELSAMTPAPEVTPTATPSVTPAAVPSVTPTATPVMNPGATDSPLSLMTGLPTMTPLPTVEPTPSPTPKPTATPAPTAQAQVRTEDGSFPELNEKGFLDEGEFIFKDVDNGIWRYCSGTLKVEIIRYQTSSPKMCWYEA